MNKNPDILVRSFSKLTQTEQNIYGRYLELVEMIEKEGNYPNDYADEMNKDEAIGIMSQESGGTREEIREEIIRIIRKISRIIQDEKDGFKD